MEKILNYIDGRLCEPVSGQYLDNINPAEGRVYSHVASSDERDVNLAVEAAERAFPVWSAMPVQERSSLLLKISDLINRDLEKLALAESLDNGKTVSSAKVVDIPRAASNMRFFATAALHHFSDAHHTDRVAINYTTWSPIGVVGCISPWNLPLYLFTWKIAPALAAGCTVVAKPSELTPMTAFLFSSICIEAGLPAGVLNIIHGTGSSAGHSIVNHPSVRAISFTGGTVTGKKIAAAAAPEFKKLSLELGGKNANVIFADCDFEKAVSTSILSSFSNQGEICLCGSRILVEASLYEKFLTAFIAKTRELKVGDPLDQSTQVGALISESHLQKVQSYVDLAIKEGGTIVTGGKRIQVPGRCEDGFFFEPTVITGLTESCRTNQEEIFGPVVTIMPFHLEEEAIRLANSTTYGLSATVWTENLSRAHRVSAALKTGIVWVNCWLLRDLRTPFGGVKNSGVGREGGWYALEFFMESKNTCIRL